MQITHRIIRRLAVSILVGATAATWTAADASAKIVVGQGIAGVKLGESQTQVRRHLGKPAYVQPPAWGYRNPLDGQVSLDYHRHVNDIWTTSRRQKTNRGIGPGSSVKAARRAYPNARCYQYGRSTGVCVLRTRNHQRVVETDFWFRGALSKVDIFLVPPIPKRRPA